MTLPLPFFTRFLVRAVSLLMLLLGVSLLTQSQSNATPVIRYVRTNGPNTNPATATSWATSTINLQGAINASAPGDQVWVATGTYKPGGNANTDRTVSFAMKNGVNIYGGFAGNETALSARPVITLTTPSATTLSGDIGTAGDPDDNSFHVILNLLGVTNITVLDGFVITGGNANEAGPPQEPRNIGGGLCNVGQSSFNNPSSGPASSPQISNCLFQANSATSGGAIYNGAGGSGVSSPTLTNCVFRANTATSGGAMYNVGRGGSSASQPKLTNCLFQANSATTSGGAIYNDGNSRSTSSPELTTCSFQDNRAATGGAIYNDGGSDEGNSSPTLTNCSFKTNRATNQGGAIFNNGDFDGNSSPLIRNCSFQTNSAASGGGAIFNQTGRIRGNNMSSPKLTNCLLQTNTASSGGAIYNFTRYEGGINLVLTNCTFQANTADAGSAIFGYGYGNGYVATSTLTNCVLFGNGGAKTFYNDFTTISATYSLFDDSVTGYSGSTGNRTVTVSPFANTSDPALFACSPAVNAGLNSGLNSATGLVGVTTDLVGNPRVFGNQVDMGAYEYQAAGGLTLTTPNVSTATVGVAFSQPFTASGGTSPYSYSVASGSLPTGLSLATNGTLSGTPTQLGSFSITVKATNATSCSGVSAAYVLQLSSAAPIRYVRAGATGSGSSWADASGDLQSQIDFAGTQQVWVTQGTYKPGPAGNTNRTISFSMKNGVIIYGGFAGNETALSQRVLGNPLATMLSGDIGTAGDNADNSYHVINNPAGLTNSAVLDGFLITGGNANDSAAPNDAGGGMLNNGNGANNTCSPLIRNCIFQNNAAANGGGALYNAGYTNGKSNPILINCSFQANSAGSGGAIYNDGSIGGNSNPSLTNCSFQANSAGSGGAMSSVGFQGNSRPVLTNCVVWGNGGASTFTNGPGSSITTSYSLFESSITNYSPGTGNLTTTVSPFVSVTDTRLNGCSPALNSGDNAAYTTAIGGMPPSTAIDLAGNARAFSSGGPGTPAVIDMGAYEFQTTGSLSISAPGVSTTPVGVGFSQSFTATIGTSPYSYSVASGSLPPGLSLATTGVLSGTPTQMGSFTLTAKAADANGCSGVSAPYVLTVGPGSPIRYVRAGGSGSGNSWADASGNLQRQIDFAGAQQVWVAQGTYKPTTTTGPDSRTISFTMKNGVRIIGGFSDIDTPTLAERNPGRFVTTLSGDIGAVGNTADNSYHVINNTYVDNTAVLDGFLITGGNANGTSDQPTDGKGFGGGMYNIGGNPILIDCIFQTNSASFEGGGLFNYGSSRPVLTNCSFQGNSASYGGGMANNGSSPTAIFCSFQSNKASSLGGGVYTYYGSPKLISCIFQANSATEGGGMYTGSESNPTVVNGLFQSNSAQRGGGVANAYTNVTLTNCSFQGNTASIFGGGVYNFSCSSTLANCVLFGNGDDNTFYSVSGSVGATFCLMEATVTGYTGDNNLTTAVSPFVSATDGRLNGCSPAINAGNNAAYTTANTSAGDPDGNARIFPSGGRIDMGAYEYQAAPGQTPTVVIPSVSTATAGISFSQPFTASGGISPYSYSLVSGSLAPGLSLAPTGVVSGTPTKSGSFTITALAADATGCSGVSAPYVLTVAPFLPRYVRQGASGSGSSWDDASGDLQGQISLASDQQVWVAQGTYKPGPAGNTNRSISFAMKNGVTILGGFPATGTPTLSERYPGRYVTTLSGDIGAVGNTADNSYHVINNPSSLSLTGSAVLDGFLITGGNANGTGRQINGGGIYNNYSSPTLTNCSFVGNSAIFGGGIFNDYSGPTLTNCSFQTNTASYDGGAIQNFRSTSTLTNCSFQGNTAAGLGGAIYNNDNNIILTNCVLWNNGGNNTFYNGSGGGATSGASITTSYSLFDNTVTKYSTGAGNLTTTVSPFVSTTDARLQAGSVALNAGSNTAYQTANGPATDLEGLPRILGGTIDMGAYELPSDLTLTLVSRPSTVYGTTAISVLVNVIELNGVATDGSFSVRLSKDPKLSLSLDPNVTKVGSQLVQNSAWSLSGPVGGFYILTTNQAVGAGDVLSVGLSGTVSPGATSGALTISSILVPGTLPEAKGTNNADAEKIEYFQQ